MLALIIWPRLTLIKWLMGFFIWENIRHSVSSAADMSPLNSNNCLSGAPGDRLQPLLVFRVPAFTVGLQPTSAGLHSGPQSVPVVMATSDSDWCTDSLAFFFSIGRYIRVVKGKKNKEMNSSSTLNYSTLCWKCHRVHCDHTTSPVHTVCRWTFCSINAKRVEKKHVKC